MTIGTDMLGVDERTQELLFTHARSPLMFAQEPVPLAAIRAAYDLIKWGPTGNNAMPLRLAIANSEWARGAALAAAAPGNRVKVETAPTLLIVAADHDYHHLVHVTAPGVDGLKERLASAPDRRAVSAHDNTWLQLGYLIVGLRAAGLAVRPMGGFDKQALTSELFADTGWHAEMLLAVGYPAPDGEDGIGPRAGRPSWDDAATVL